MRRNPVVLSVAVLAMIALPALAEDAPKKKIANPEYTNWSKFAVGAFVELTSVSEAMGQKSSNKMTHKLVELTKEKAVVETSTSIEGMPAEFAPKPQRRDVPAELEVPDVQVPPGTRPEVQVKEGEETIDVTGTKVKCKTVESTVEAGGMTTKSKVWTSDEIPGMSVRMEVRTEGKMGDQAFVSTVTTTVTKWSAK